ncbi:MAG: hypothetical protein DSY89_10120 [Deltaproteobacteria bacterium]|nr:MAG: hypothetical protein DSY89_10120 [Deltaproteobacteria bacterium]
MMREILIIAKDHRRFQQIEKACRPSFRNLTFIFARTTRDAADLLREHHIALILLEPLTRRERTPSLLSYIWKFYPDIPVLNMAGDRESVESLIVGEEGISVQPVPTLPAENWAEIIRQALQGERDGGSIYVSDISLFAQMIEQEQRTCTLRVYDDVHHRVGILFFQDGEIKNARLKKVQGKAAACEVLTWESIWIDIQDSCELPAPRIKANLQAILIEGRLNKDNEADDDTAMPGMLSDREEEAYYRTLVDSDPDAPASSEKEKSTCAAKAATKLPSRTRRSFLSMVAALLLALLAVTAYMANQYRDNPRSQKTGAGEKDPAATVRFTAAKPPSKAPAVKSSKPARAAAAPSKKVIKKISRADPLKINRSAASPAPTVFLYYTFSKNRSLTEQLANYLAARGVAVGGVEQAEYTKNEVRYFHTDDLRGVKTIYGYISAFLNNSHISVAGSRFTFKDLSKNYPHVPRGQIEVWLRLTPPG